ncbi:MAG: spore germination protein [Enterocloster sp.]
MQNPQWIPDWLQFIQIADEQFVPLIWQLLILNSPSTASVWRQSTLNMLTTPLSVIAGIVLGEYSVKSGWFNSETMLYIISSPSQTTPRPASRWATP